MNEEQETKKEWAAPEIVDLDMDKTSKVHTTTEQPSNLYGPNAS